MRIKLTPDRALQVEKARLNGVPTLILLPEEREPANVGLMWIQGGGFIIGMKEMVYNRAVGLVTGAVLTVLGGSMLILHFWPQIFAVPLSVQTLNSLGRLIGFGLVLFFFGPIGRRILGFGSGGYIGP